MNQQDIQERFSKFENFVLFYDFYKLTIKWLCEHFFNQKLCAFVICSYEPTGEKLDEKKH